MRQWTTFRFGKEQFAVMSEEAPMQPAPTLTAAEQQVLELLLSGASNAEIAKKRKTAIRTVANQVASLFRKYAVGSRAELAARLST